MANVQVGDAFAGLEGAKVEDRNPKLPENWLGILKIANTENIKGRFGLTMIIEHFVEASDDPRTQVGGLYTTTITGIDGPNADMKLGKVKNYLASGFQIDPTKPLPPGRTWQQIVAYATEKNALKDKLVKCQTGPKSWPKDQMGKPEAMRERMYIPVVFSPYVAQE